MNSSEIIGIASIFVTGFIGWLSYWITKRAFSYSQGKQDFEHISYAIEFYHDVSHWIRFKRELFFRTISFFKDLNNLESMVLIDLIRKGKIADKKELYKILYAKRSKLIELYFEKESGKIDCLYRRKHLFILSFEAKKYTFFCWFGFLIYCFFIVSFGIDTQLFKQKLWYILIPFIIGIPEVIMLISIEKRQQIEWLEEYFSRQTL